MDKKKLQSVKKYAEQIQRVNKDAVTQKLCKHIFGLLIHIEILDGEIRHAELVDKARLGVIRMLREGRDPLEEMTAKVEGNLS